MLLIAVINIRLNPFYKKWLGLVWIIIGCELVIPTFLAGLNLILPKRKTEYWSEGNIGFIYIGLVYILIGLFYVINYQDAKEDIKGIIV